MIEASLPKISVVICTYNRCSKLRDTLVSLAQMPVSEDLPWELVVVDNNSSDKTKDVVEAFAEESCLNAKYVLECAAGLSHARNRGIAESRGAIISFLDDDVVVASDWLTEIWKAFEKYDAMCVGGRVLLHKDIKVPAWWHESFNVGIGKFDRGDSVIRPENGDTELIGIGANMSFRRMVFEKYGLFNTEMGRIGNGHRTGEETEVVLELRRKNEKVIYYPGAVVYHCISSDRFSKQYLRMNSYHFGKWRYLSESELHSKSLKILGMPLWMYRSTLEAIGMMICLTLLGRHREAFSRKTHVGLYRIFYGSTAEGPIERDSFQLAIAQA